MLHLKLPTDPRWADLAEMNVEEILTDHAYCEQKAASSCISLVQQYPERERLVEELSPIVTEEWGHFRMVLAEIKRRGLQLGRQRKDEYVNQMAAFIKKQGNREEVLMERLLLCALIEARSCERFRMLSLHLSDETLRRFYHTFMVAEAGHFVTFYELAKAYASEHVVKKRWEEILQKEAEVVLNLDHQGKRIH